MNSWSEYINENTFLIINISMFLFQGWDLMAELVYFEPFVKLRNVLCQKEILSSKNW